ncbi:pentapeptide repeat-containing protein [Parafrankia sp. EUN1f]|uniref:pentapeptide repeat-containing protein n=1 Tax=Parafrankia sp. EUN1f TaxID=102897 RepID=UPI0001C441CB|nr:pentapeptide repeat-containing protein [Parafrankia sp. EUN1f]EFC86709.1 pentapeptide repeat protein [Parafrankia sp. EUN1f]
MTADSGGSGRRGGRRGLWIVAGIAALGAVCAVVGIWHLPARMYPAADQSEARAALQGGLLTAAAALIAVTGGLVALDETRQANAEVRRANENTHVRELYTRAVDQLGSEIVTIRLGGIYALERIAVDSPADQRTVVEVLSAFVRVRGTALARTSSVPATAGDEPLEPTYPAADIRAAIQVLARLPARRGVPRCDLTGTELTGPASLAHLSLTGANLTGAWLSGADLTGAVLSGADLTDVRLRGADLTGAWLDEANLTNARLSRANLTNAWLDEANLTDARLSRANLTNAVGLSQEQVDVARGDRETQLPTWLVRPASWSPEGPLPD